MKTCYIYSFLAPIDDEEFKDNNDIPPLGTIPITRGTAPTREAAILGTPNRVKAFRLAIPDKEGDTLDPADLRKFFKYRKLMLDSIRLAYDPSAEFYRQDDEVFYAYNFTDAGEGPNLGLRIAEELNPDYRVNVEGIRRLFAVPVSLRPIIHLLADGSDSRLPLQFRFLSLYKIVEMHYRITPNRQFNEFITPFIPLFHGVYPDASSALGKNDPFLLT